MSAGCGRSVDHQADGSWGILFGNVAFTLAAASLLFVKIDGVVCIMAILSGFGTCIGTVTPPVLTSNVFGSKYNGEIYGMVCFFACVGSAIGGSLIATYTNSTRLYSGIDTVIINGRIVYPNQEIIK